MYSNELINFVSILLYGNEPDPIDLETAQEDIAAWEEEYDDLPEDLTPENYMKIWNELIEEN